MALINEKSVLKAIDNYVCVENRTVFAKSLANEFNLNYVTIDRLMNEYIKKCKGKEIPIKVTYMLSGYNNDCDKPDEIKLLRFLIAEEDELEERKKYFTELTGCQVRSIKNADEDMETVNNVDLPEEDSPIVKDLETLKQLQMLTLILNDKIKIREKRLHLQVNQNNSKSAELTSIKSENKTKSNIEIKNDSDEFVNKCVKKVLNNKKENIKNMFSRIDKSKYDEQIKIERKEIKDDEIEDKEDKLDDKITKNASNKKDISSYKNASEDEDKILEDKSDLKEVKSCKRRKSHEISDKISKKVKQNEKSGKKRRRVRFIATDSESENDKDSGDEEEENLNYSDIEIDEKPKHEENRDDSNEIKSTTACVSETVDELFEDEDGYLVTKKIKKMVTKKVEETAKIDKSKEIKKPNKSPNPPHVSTKKNKIPTGQSSITNFFKPSIKA